MFKLLDRWFKRRIHEAVEVAMLAANDKALKDSDDFDDWLSSTGDSSQQKSKFKRENGMTFTIYPARGGLVVEYEQFNEKIGEMDHGLHIITSDQDIGDALSKIITIEQLRK
jgi:hypothetical protein